MDNITILITTRNRPDFLDCAIKSVRLAFGSGTKVIIGDNGDYNITDALLTANNMYELDIQHIENPKGSSYFYNLQKVIDTAQTEWISLLHDDDFFTEECGSIVKPFLDDKSIDFIFSDVWVASDSGEISLAETRKMTQQYRNNMVAGYLENLTVHAIDQSIGLDGFFVRTRLAQKTRVNPNCNPADYAWMIELCETVNKGRYISNKLFTYRLNLTGGTSLGCLNENETLQCLFNLIPKMGKIESKKSLKSKIHQKSFHAFKYSLKRLDIANAGKALFYFLGVK